MYNDNIHIGKKIQYVYKQSGLIVTQFARMIGISRPQVYRIFENKTIDIDLLCKISDVLHYDFLSEVYIKKREEAYQNPTSIHVHFQVSVERLDDFIKSVNRLKKAGLIE